MSFSALIFKSWINEQKQNMEIDKIHSKPSQKINFWIALVFESYYVYFWPPVT